MSNWGNFGYPSGSGNFNGLTSLIKPLWTPTLMANRVFKLPTPQTYNNSDYDLYNFTAPIKWFFVLVTNIGNVDGFDGVFAMRTGSAQIGGNSDQQVILTLINNSNFYVDTFNTSPIGNGSPLNVGNVSNFNIGVPLNKTYQSVSAGLNVQSSSSVKNLMVGADSFNTSSRSLSGTVVDLLFFSKTPSDSEIDKFHGYYAWNNDGVVHLPDNHPHKLAPPTV